MGRKLLFAVFIFIPSIQIMGYVVALAAFREFAQNACRVWRAVTVLAGRDHFVGFLVALGARQLMMFAGAGQQEIIRFIMTGRTAF